MSSGLKPYVFRTSTTAPTPFMLNTGNRTSCSALIFDSSWSEATDSPSIPPTWPTTPTLCTNLHPILKRLPNLPKDHNNAEIQTLQAKLDDNLENGPVNVETLTIAMDLVLAIFCKESPQHLITKRPDCITIIKRRLELRLWSEALELYQEEGRNNLNNYSSITVWYPYPLAALEEHAATRETMKAHTLEARRKWRTPYTNIPQIYLSEKDWARVTPIERTFEFLWEIIQVTSLEVIKGIDDMGDIKIEYVIKQGDYHPWVSETEQLEWLLIG